MNPKSLPKQIRKDLQIARRILTADGHCNPVLIDAAAALLEDIAEQIRTALFQAENKTRDHKAPDAGGEKPRFLAARALCETAVELADAGKCAAAGF